MDAAAATRKLLEQSAPPGLYHCVNSGSCTWLDLAREVARQLGVEPKLVPVRMADAKLRAERPMYCVLSNAKLTAQGIAMPTWHDRMGEFEKATDLPARLREEIEHFFLDATFFTPKNPKILRWRGTKRATALIGKANQQFATSRH